MDYTVSEEMDDAALVRDFFESLKSEATRSNYFKNICYVLEIDREKFDRETIISKFVEFVNFCRKNPVSAERQLGKWILGKRKEEIAGITIRSYITGVRSLLDYCGVQIPWKRINKNLPHISTTTDKEATPIDASRKLFSILGLREKFLESLFVSSGIRLGAIDYLHAGDLVEYVEETESGKKLPTGLGLLTVYRSEPEEYNTFTSSECLNLWKEYVSQRENFGEKIRDEKTGEIRKDAPLLRNIMAVQERHRRRRIEDVIALSSNSIRDLFSNLWKEAGFTPQTRTWKEIHGWRSAYKTTLENSGVKTVRVEKLIGHAEGLQHSYDKPLLKELAADYLRAEKYLTLNEALIAKSEVTEIKDSTRREMREYKTDLILANQEISNLQKKVSANDELMRKVLAKLEESEKERAAGN